MARDDQAAPACEAASESRRIDLPPDAYSAPPECPDALYRIGRTIVAQTHARRAFLPDVTGEDPEWLMLLELFIASDTGRQVTVTNLCAASGVPSTTALRHIALLERNGLLIRTPAARDRRISHVRLHERAQRRLQSYLASIAACRLHDDEGLARA